MSNLHVQATPLKVPDADKSKPQTSQNDNKRQQMIWALGFGGFLVNADSRAITPMLPAISHTFHTDASTAALLITAYSIPYGVFQLAFGPIADRFGKVRTILMSLCLFAVGTIACGFVHDFTWLLIMRFITGMFAAGIIPTTLALIGDQFTITERPRTIAFFMSFSTTGQALGIVLGGLVAQFASFSFLFFIIGLVAFPALLAMFLQRKHGAAPAGETIALRLRYIALLKNRRAWLIYGLVFTEGFMFFGGFTFLSVYGVSVLHLSYLAIGLLTAIYSLGAFLGSRTITVVLYRIGAPRMPVLGSLLMAAGFGVVWSWETVIGLTLGFLVLGFGFSYCHSTLQTYATDLLPEGRATAVSVFAFSLFLGSGLGPVAGGSVYDLFGVGAMLGAATGGMLLFCLMCSPFLRKQAVLGNK
jgi:predicted MFS family arabinose efflux permease